MTGSQFSLPVSQCVFRKSFLFLCSCDCFGLFVKIEPGIRSKQMFILINGFNSTNPNSSSVSFCLRSRTLTLRHHEENSGALNTAAVTQGQSPQHIWTLTAVYNKVLCTPEYFSNTGSLHEILQFHYSGSNKRCFK